MAAGMNEIERAAVHESAHATMAFRFGRRIRHVQVADDGTGATHCQMLRRVARWWLPASAWRKRVAEEAVISLSGPLAERKFCGCLSRQASTVDFKNASQWLKKLGRNREQTAIEITYKLLDSPRTWRAVETIAAALIEHGHLTGAQVEAVCRTCGVSG